MGEGVTQQFRAVANRQTQAQNMDGKVKSQNIKTKYT